MMMTQNQIAYHTMMETQRSNRTREQETERANRAVESETKRSNQARERVQTLQYLESAKHNRATEFDATRKTNLEKLKYDENARHNEVTESHNYADMRTRQATASANAAYQYHKIDAENYLLPYQKTQLQTQAFQNITKGIDNIGHSVAQFVPFAGK